MEQGVFLRHIRLLDATGAEVLEPFRETELWSADGRRLTLWFHPGRQKTGVNLNEEFGPVLRAGGHYRLVVSGAWRTQSGPPLGADLVKTFVAGAADHAPPTMKNWRITPPVAGTRQPVRVDFPEPLDWALLQSQLQVETPDGQVIPGEISLGEEERSWSFTPRQPWQPGTFEISAGTVLEDLAGNSLARPFEVDVSRPAPATVGPTLKLPFQVGETGR